MNTKIEISDDDMRALWEFMGDQYGASFTKQYGMKLREWRKTFIRKGFTPRHLELGMQKCLELCETHAPNLSTFSSRCTPSMHDYHLPDEDEAYMMAVRKLWTHPIVWHAVKNVGQYEFRQWPESRSRKAFIKEYLKLFRLHVAGERLVIPVCDVEALPQPLPTKDELIESRDYLKVYLGRNPGFNPEGEK